jgi:hypothetical protein
LPLSTPTVEEIQSASAQKHQEWLDSLQREVMACPESGDPEGCVASVGARIYTHYGWDLSELARSGEDNPIPADSDEVRLMGPQIAGNLTDPVVGAFLKQLDLNLDHSSNFEPGFVEALKAVKDRDYARAVENVRDHGWDIGVAQEVLKRMVPWTAGPLLGQYFATSE